MNTIDEKNKSQNSEMSRREFLGNASLVGAAATAFTIVPRHVLGGQGYKAPSDLLNVACIAVGGKGRSDCEAVCTENLVAVCDVDDTRMDEFIKAMKDKPEVLAKFEKATKYRDFREMLEKEKSIEAVTVSTPDHTHAVAAVMAMKMGKHVFCQKPLTHTVHEARMMAKTAKEMNVVTQMGNQGHASDSARQINEWIWDGAIGDVHEVHCWTNRPVWAQALDAPKEIPSCPPTLDWNLWLGPSKWRPYHPAYVPWNWRGWFDFGTGAIGDMGAHIMDQPFWTLKLGAPKTVQASSTPFTKDSFPMACVITYTFPARGKMPPVKMTWFDGGLKPPRPEALEPGKKIGDDGGGIIFYGKKGVLIANCYSGDPRLIPESRMKEYRQPAQTIPRSTGITKEWIEAIKAGKKSTTDFAEYAGPLTEMMLLGNVAVRLAGKNTTLEWDSEKMEFTNLPEANEYLQMPYREGWSL